MPQGPPSSSWQNSGLQGIGRTFAGLEFDELLNLLHFAGDQKATPHDNLAALRLSLATERDRLAVEYIHKTCLSFHRRRKAVAKKKEI
jgi:hypothetical protein